MKVITRTKHVHQNPVLKRHKSNMKNLSKTFCDQMLVILRKAYTTTKICEKHTQQQLFCSA